MTYRFHGNYCGPGWSDGKYQDSVVGRLPAIDEFDQTCKEHDAAYAQATDPKSKTRADDMFITQNFGRSVARTLAAVAVASNRIPRWLDPLGNTKYTTHYPKPHDLFTKQPNQLQINHMPKNRNLRGPKPMGTQNTKNKSNGQTSYAPIARSRTVRIKNPTSATRGNATVIKHREYLRLVTSSVSQNIVAIDVNPGLQSCFNWLSTIARGYEKYRFKTLTFTYVSASSTSEKGRVALAFQYDPSAPPPHARTDFFNVTPNVEEAPWEDIVLHVQPPQGVLYTRRAGTVGTLNTFDIGKLLVMSALNANGTTELGEIFVEYEVELSRPQYISALDGKMVAASDITNVFSGDLTLSHGTLLFSKASGNSLEILAPCNILMCIKLDGTAPTMFTPTYTQTPGSNGYVVNLGSAPYANSTAFIVQIELQQCQAGDLVNFNATNSTALTDIVLRYGEYQAR